ncbi:MAG: RNA-binding protein [bacterium]|nr:RNA-binding protein [bacterium]
MTLEPLERTLMSAKLYIGNLPYSLTEDELRKIFEGVGEVVSARIALDRETRRPRGFGFVEMASAELAQDAVSRLNQSMVSGRAIIVNEARPQENRPRPEGRRTGGYDRPRSY